MEIDKRFEVPVQLPPNRSRKSLKEALRKKNAIEVASKLYSKSVGASFFCRFLTKPGPAENLERKDRSETAVELMKLKDIGVVLRSGVGE
jgi:hypothetical protein